MKTLDNYRVENKKVLLRVDLNVPVVNGFVTDKNRIKAIKKTIKRLKNQKNKIFLVSHFGRPKGVKDLKYSLSFLCPILESELEVNKIHFIKNFNEERIEKKINEIEYGEVCLFENIRFYPEEEKNDLDFIFKICKKFDVYINDAFSASHRNHASIVGPTKILPSIAGLSMLKEITNIDYFINNMKKPNTAIIGGSKVSSKINLLNNLINICDSIIIGGAMANTFLYSKNIKIGKSLYEKDLSSIVNSILTKARLKKCKIILPVDVVCSQSIQEINYIKNYDIDCIPDNLMALDIGYKTIKIIKNVILNSKVILWNGPLGVFEYKPFDESSIQIAKIIKEVSKSLNITTIAGGGDTVSAIKLADAQNDFDYISSAGGAFLEWLEGKGSPGVNALKDNQIN